MSPDRANEIIAQARMRAIGTPWVDQLKHVMTDEERAEVKQVWDTMPGHCSFVSALFSIANTETWQTKARQRLQARANKLFKQWLASKDGQRWKERKRHISPYHAGFQLPEYHHDLIAALNRNDEEHAKFLMLTHYLEG